MNLPAMPVGAACSIQVAIRAPVCTTGDIAVHHAVIYQQCGAAQRREAQRRLAAGNLWSYMTTRLQRDQTTGSLREQGGKGGCLAAQGTNHPVGLRQPPARQRHHRANQGNASGQMPERCRAF